MVAQQLGKTRFPHAVPATRNDGRARGTNGIGAHLRVVDLDRLDRHELVNVLIETHIDVAKSMASRYRNRGVELEDLEQVALVALTKAAQRFDPDAGHDFMAYATPTIRGELRRHFRDSGWMVRPPRRVQELQARIRDAHRELEFQLGRSPRPTELAAHLDEDLNHVVEALSADGCFAPTSLDTPVADESGVLGDLLASDDRSIEAAEARIMLAPVVERLTERDRLVLQMRYVEQRTQQQIAEAVGLTQAQVSRVLARILRHLRTELEKPDAAGSLTTSWASFAS